MPQRYTVLSTPTELRHEIEIKKSRFLTVLRRVESEEEAGALVTELRREFHDARHHCSAWVLGADRRIQRSSDDGEPSGTAGAPMLEALTLHRTAVPTDGAAGASSVATEVQDLSDVCAVVVRWFGGTLLGAGGLVRAYSDSVSQALDRAVFTQRARLGVFQLPAPLAEAARWENELRTTGVTVLGTEWSSDGATLQIATDDTPEAVAGLERHLAQLTAGTGQLSRVGTDWIDGRNPSGA